MSSSVRAIRRMSLAKLSVLGFVAVALVTTLLLLTVGQGFAAPGSGRRTSRRFRTTSGRTRTGPTARRCSPTRSSRSAWGPRRRYPSGIRWSGAPMPPTTRRRRAHSAPCSSSLPTPRCLPARSTISRPGTRQRRAAAPRRPQATCSMPTCCAPPVLPTNTRLSMTVESSPFRHWPIRPYLNMATFPVTPGVAVQAGDVIGFYGEGIPVDTGVAANPDTFSYPATADPTLATPAGACPRQPRSRLGATRVSRSTRRRTARTPSRPPSPPPSRIPGRARRRRPRSTRRRAASQPSPSPARAPATFSPRPSRSPSPGVTPTALASATAQISTGVVNSIAVNESGFGFTTPSRHPHGRQPHRSAGHSRGERWRR